MATQNYNSTRDLPCSSVKQGRIGSEVNHHISKLGDDLLAEVLIRVPDPRSACRCKPVCKRWNSLISDPYFDRRFVSHHRRRREPDPPLLIPSDDPESIILSFLPMPGKDTRRYFRVLDSFKDLILCGFSYSSTMRDLALVRSLFVCNPFTKQWIALPLVSEKPILKYVLLTARLVCRPLSTYEYQFKAVCIYEDATTTSTKLDVFCSDSGKWTENALVLSGRDTNTNYGKIVSSNDKLFWYNSGGPSPFVGINPFHLDSPLIRGDGPVSIGGRFDISVSRGVLYLVQLEKLTIVAPELLTVWRMQEEDENHGGARHISWSKQYEVSLTEISECKYDCRHSRFVCLHPEKPEIVFLEYYGKVVGDEPYILYINLRTREIGIFTKHSWYWKLFQSSISCWPTPIPRYEKLRGLYDGSYSCWVQ